MFDFVQRRVSELVHGTVFFDITEFLNNPVRAGVQRTLVETLNRWPDVNILPFHLREDGRIAILWPEVAQEMRTCFSDDAALLGDFLKLRGDKAPPELADQATRVEAARMRLRRYTENPALLLNADTFLLMKPILFNVELFFHPPRHQFYEKAIGNDPDAVHFFIHDFMPFLRPEVDPDLDFSFSAHFMGYVHLMRRAHRVSFNSTNTSHEYDRISRGRGGSGPVLTLGADGLCPRASAPMPADKHFVVLGAIEPRKRQLDVLRIFKRLIAERSDIRVTFVGKLVRLSEEDRIEFLANVSDRGSIRWVSNVRDADLIALIRSARATIFASRIEGFGLPPLESLSLGVPTITVRGLPSMEGLPDQGHVVIDDIAAELAGAVELFLDDAAAAAKRREVDRLPLPTWDGVARGMHDWVAASPAAIAAARKPADATPRERLLALRPILATCRAVRGICAMDTEKAIMRFHEAILGRRPTAAEWSAWYGLARRTEPTSAALCLAMLAQCRDAVTPGLHPDLISIAIAPDRDLLGWVSSIGPARPGALADLLRPVVLALRLPRRHAVPALCSLLRLPALPADAEEETLPAFLERSTDSPLVRDLARHDPADADAFQTIMQALAHMVVLADAHSDGIIPWTFETLLKRPASEQDQLDYRNHMRTYGALSVVATVGRSEEAYRANPHADALLCIVTAADSLAEGDRPVERALATLLDFALVPDAALFLCGLESLGVGTVPDDAFRRPWAPGERLNICLSVLDRTLAGERKEAAEAFRARAGLVLAAGLAAAGGDRGLLGKVAAALGETAPVTDAGELRDRLAGGLAACAPDVARDRLHVVAALVEGARGRQARQARLGAAALEMARRVPLPIARIAQGWLDPEEGAAGPEPAGEAVSEAERDTLRRLRAIASVALAREDEVGDPAFVAAAYQAVLGRAPDEDGAASYRRALAAGTPRPQILVHLADSEEYRQLNRPRVEAVWIRTLWRTAKPAGARPVPAGAH